MSRRHVRRFLHMNFEPIQAEKLLERYDNLYYSDITAQYEKLLTATRVEDVIDLEEIISLDLRDALRSKDAPAYSYMVHDVVLMVLYNQSDERTLQEFTKAITEGDEKLLESVLHSRDPFGKYRNMVLDTFGDSVS